MNMFVPIVNVAEPPDPFTLMPPPNPAELLNTEDSAIVSEPLPTNEMPPPVLSEGSLPPVIERFESVT